MSQMVISVSINSKQHKRILNYIEFLMSTKEISKAKACRYLMLRGLEKCDEEHLNDALRLGMSYKEEDI